MDRILAAQERVRAIKAELGSPKAELPCIQCRYFELVCTHPAASQIEVDPISGKTKATYLAAEKARAEEGACGPEGALFDGRSLFGRTVVAVLNSAAGRWGLFIAAAITLDALLR